MFIVFADADLGQLEDRYGAVAHGRVGERSVYGYSWKYEWPNDAHTRAFRECRKQGGRKCHLRMIVRNGCLAVARASHAHGFGSGPTKGDAERWALWQCAVSACRIVHSECSHRE